MDLYRVEFFKTHQRVLIFKGIACLKEDKGKTKNYVNYVFIVLTIFLPLFRNVLFCIISTPQFVHHSQWVKMKIQAFSPARS